MLQNDYLSSPQRLFELKKRFINVELEVLKINQFKYLDYNEKKENNKITINYPNSDLKVLIAINLK